MCCPLRIAAKTTIHNMQKRGVKLSDLILRFLGIAVTLLVCFSGWVNQSSYRRTSITVNNHPLNAIDLQSAIVVVRRWQKDMTALHRNHSIYCALKAGPYLYRWGHSPPTIHVSSKCPPHHTQAIYHTQQAHNKRSAPTHSSRTITIIIFTYI